MKRGPLQNYLRTHRKRTGLSQEEIARLVGAERDTTVSRHETGQRVPALEIALGYGFIYQVPLRELFAGQVAEVERTLSGRAERLLGELNGHVKGPRAEQKLETLARLSSSREALIIPLWREG